MSNDMQLFVSLRTSRRRKKERQTNFSC